MKVPFFSLTFAFLILLAGCGGSSPSAPVGSNDPVNDDATPPSGEVVVPATNDMLPGYVGVSVTVDDGTVAALADGDFLVDVSSMSISSQADITDGDLTRALGQTFFRFQNDQEGISTIAYVSTPYDVLKVIGCHPDTDFCISPDFDIEDNGFVSFNTRSGYFYAIEIERGEG